jgi:hypothetical protein
MSETYDFPSSSPSRDIPTREPESRIVALHADREQALAALVQKRQARLTNQSALRVTDPSGQLREMLRLELERSTEFSKQCRILKQQVWFVCEREPFIHPFLDVNVKFQGC